MARDGNSDRVMAAHLVKSGYPHGRRRSTPRPNSGGTTAATAAGSAKYQRRVAGKAGA